MSNDINETSKSATEKTLKICRVPGLGKRLRKLSGALKLENSNRQELKSLFSADEMPHRPSLQQNEVAFSFWGFVKTHEIRLQIQQFLHWLFNPRVYMTALNDKTKFFEGIMIISVNKLGITSYKLGRAAAEDAFESWIDCFFGTLQISAGTLVFKDYLGAQMLSCMERIYHSDQLRSNIFSEQNKDFRLLYANLVEKNNNNNKVLQATGRHFTTNNFISMFANQRSDQRSDEGIHWPSPFQGDWNWRVLLRTPPPLRSPHATAAIAAAIDNGPIRLFGNEIVEGMMLD